MGPKQLPLWAGMDGNSRTAKSRFLKKRRDRAGEKTKFRKKKQNLSDNEKVAVQMMRDLKSDHQIATELGSSLFGVRLLRNKVFGSENDPYPEW